MSNPAFQLNYISTGSGTGLKGWFAHDAADFWGDALIGGNPGSPYPSVDYANAETAMQVADVQAYSNTGSSCLTSPATGLQLWPRRQRLQLHRLRVHNTAPMIQVPLLITPVDLGYDSDLQKACKQRRRNNYFLSISTFT